MVDDHSIHRTKPVQAKLKELHGGAKLIFLPPYAPQPNPAEEIWAQMKQEAGRQIVFTKQDSLKGRNPR